MLRLFLRTYLPEDILAKTDRASMFNSLEVRAPFLDRRVVEFAAALPTRFKIAGGRRKVILKTLAKRYLPAAIVDRKKHGFAVPIGSLMRDLFREDRVLANLRGELYAEIAAVWGLALALFFEWEGARLQTDEIRLAVIVTLVGAFLTRVIAIARGTKGWSYV